MNQVDQDVCVAQSANGTTSLRQWHERLVHQNYEYVVKLLKSKNRDVVGKKEACDACILGKVHRQSYRRSDNRATEIGAVSGIMVGYSENVKGYRIWFESRNRVEVHRDVIFKEQERYGQIPQEVTSSQLVEDTSQEHTQDAEVQV